MMKATTSRAGVTALMMAALLGIYAGFASGGTGHATPAEQPSNFADEAFKTTWERTDRLVYEGKVQRSYYWGPTPLFSLYEDYAEGQGGTHLVQYFDKSRMEINDPRGDRNGPFFVTNGLLTVELISGRMQVGNNSFVQRPPAEINLASDFNDTSEGTPTYASFRSVFNSYGEKSRVGEAVTDTINRRGQVGTGARYAGYGLKYAYYEPTTRHSIPGVFWDFLNQSGPVIVGGRESTARLSDPWFYTTGYPITDAYWASVTIAGVANTDVLVQPFERRVLTYVPNAPQGWKVQMGNIGLHYHDWRYGLVPGPVPTDTGPVRCMQVPVRGFGKVWADHPEVQAYLGCTFSPEKGITVAYQPFEHGQMLDVIEQYGTSTFKVIYVMFEDGTVQRFQDTYVDGSPEPAPTEAAPPGRYVPIRGFGKVWREGTGARVRERLGWATAREVGTNEGAMQYFPKGLMVHTGPQLKQIFVLYSSTAFGAYDIDRWRVYNDTYQP